jgi:diacylglycerol kinase (ATP)
VLLNVVLIPIAFWLPVSRAERAITIAVCLLGLIVELFNSAVEAAIDRISLERHPAVEKRQGHGQRRAVGGNDHGGAGVGVILLARSAAARSRHCGKARSEAAA